MSAYYNENDPKAAAWLRELIAQGHIADGYVDTRSIADVQPDDLHGYTQCHFFAGIGGWSHALRLAGWPDERPVWSGSCPCQPFSTAGKGLAQKDERHLWPAFFDLIRQCRPEHVFGEQVASAISHGWLDGISADLEAEGYTCGATVLGAHSVNAPHQRQRLYWVADAGYRQRGRAGEQQSWSQAPPERSKAAANSQRCSTSDGLDDTRRQSDERRGEPGNVGRSASQEQREARERQWGGNADSDPMQDDRGLVLSNSDGCGERSRATAPTGHGHTTNPASFWSDFQLVHCRDGKNRRAPTEPLLQRVANGIPLTVDFMRNIVGELKTQIVRHAKKTDSTAIETLREMQYAFWAEAIQWDSRGRIGLLSPEILLAALCQLERELGDFEFSSSQSIIKAQEAIMLRVRKDTPKKAATCPPSRWEYAQQLAREFADALHELSHENTLEAAQSIFDRALGFPLTTKCPARATLLRGYGNAIVPQVAATFIQAYLKAKDIIQQPS